MKYSEDFGYIKNTNKNKYKNTDIKYPTFFERLRCLFCIF